jgi:hypothetical protein
MTFLSDLDPLAWVATFVAIIVFCSVTFLNLRDWRNHWTIDFEARIPIIVYLGIALIVGAFNSYSPNANAPRKTVEGVARFVSEVSGKGGYTEYICATSCQLTGGYALRLHGKAAGPVRIGSRYVFTYLQHPVGNAVFGISLQVIEVSEPDSGRVLYKMDLTNHPYRIVAYLLNFALLVSAGLLGGLLNRTRRSRAEATASSEEPDISEAVTTGDAPISLGLESRDAS